MDRRREGGRAGGRAGGQAAEMYEGWTWYGIAYKEGGVVSRRISYKGGVVWVQKWEQG